MVSIPPRSELTLFAGEWRAVTSYGRHFDLLTDEQREEIRVAFFGIPDDILAAQKWVKR